ncbi:MAG: hypothetical protein IJ207_07825 [Treponema sp.]|uniref:hypothetical protein n=1 Tax=Treponema sp. TaxID=166 RepID=UPI0025D1D906|nr:hypothetical protein [Treponema sp.]MBQ9282096.1 hypothetical protein [Treponema sp.]
MSRNDRRRGGRNQNWNNRDGSTEKNERSERGRSRENRSERKHESRGSGSYERRQERRRILSQVNQKEIEENQAAIRAFKEQVVTCEICGEPITDIASAISNRGSEKPVHFDCVLAKLSADEKLAQSDKIAYIGQGKFAVLHFENPHDQKHFTIRKTIEWEGRESERGSWRDEMAGLFSQVK